MNSAHVRITNYQSVVNFLGGWPSFDDFEVVSILLERGEPDGSIEHSLTILFSAFRGDVPPGSPGRGNCLITLRFTGFENLKLEGFNHQNAINGLVVSSKWSGCLKREVFDVRVIRGFGVGAAFECDAIEVVSVTPIQ
jgi:hypothetical protein